MNANTGYTDYQKLIVENWYQVFGRQFVKDWIDRVDKERNKRLLLLLVNE